MQSAGVTPLTLSPVGQALFGPAANAALPGETEQQRRKRLAGLTAAQGKIASALSPAGAALGLGSGLTL
jgi:hypothetical protein